jgi:enoyl-CoA hydratase/carnithine racemase
MMAMGKLKNPMTDKIERDLSQAKQSIDILEMIREKTHNNLSPELLRTLEHALTELRLNFVDETNKQPTTT